jgi:hypothetical protein
MNVKCSGLAWAPPKLLYVFSINKHEMVKICKDFDKFALNKKNPKVHKNRHWTLP